MRQQIALERNLFTCLRHYLCSMKNGSNLKLLGVGVEYLCNHAETFCMDAETSHMDAETFCIIAETFHNDAEHFCMNAEEVHIVAETFCNHCGAVY